MSLAVKAGACALPFASVPTVAELDPLAANLPLAVLDPFAGALNVTVVPAPAVVTGQPLLFASTTWKGAANGESSLAVCGVPPPSVSSSGGFEVGQEGAVEPVGLAALAGRGPETRALVAAPSIARAARSASAPRPREPRRAEV